jgi:hypothetical protein
VIAEVIFTGAGALTYLWDPEDVTDGIAYAPTETALYTVLGVDANGCENKDSLVVTVYPALEITYTTIDELFGADGEIDITVTGGNPAYTFDWDNVITGDFDDTEDLMDLVAGTYIVVVVDAAGCTATETIVVDGQVGINEADLQVLIYPNPTQENINIIYSGTFNYTLTGVDGAVLLNGVAVNSEVLSLEKFATGIYYITLHVDGTSKIYKIVKQ